PSSAHHPPPPPRKSQAPPPSELSRLLLVGYPYFAPINTSPQRRRERRVHNMVLCASASLRFPKSLRTLRSLRLCGPSLSPRGLDGSQRRAHGAPGVGG